MKTEDESWQEARQMEQSLAVQTEIEQDALTIAGNVIAATVDFDRMSRVRALLCTLPPLQAAATVITVIEVLENSSFDRRDEIVRFKRFLRENA